VKAIENIQLRLGQISLKKRKKKLHRKIKAFGFEKASKIGVLYDATNRSDADLVKKFIQYLKEERKEVFSLGYINAKDASEIVKPYLSFAFFDKSQLSKTFIPKSETVNEFMKTPYSILIDLTIDESFPIEYIATLSQAKFKVGANGNHRNETCDMVIDIDNDKRLEYLIIQMKHYLQMIHN
jgi:hypothetical protein